MDEQMIVDIAWLKSEAEHCRRMDYVDEAKRFERIGVMAGKVAELEAEVEEWKQKMLRFAEEQRDQLAEHAASLAALAPHPKGME